MTVYKKIIHEIDPTADADRVMDIANDVYRYFGEMTRKQWALCVAAAKS